MAAISLKKRNAVRRRPADAFLRGFGSVLSVYGSPTAHSRVNRALTIHPPELLPVGNFETDRQVLGQTWRLVGDQLRDTANTLPADTRKERVSRHLRKIR
jgi:hypothetical protein